MLSINSAFEELRVHVPTFPFEKRYIKILIQKKGSKLRSFIFQIIKNRHFETGNCVHCTVERSAGFRL